MANCATRWGIFRLQHFWGPLAGIQSTAWIVDSAVHMANSQKPNFFYIYLPHLDYAAQKFGPDSPEAQQALVDLDGALARLIAGFNAAYGGISAGHKIEPLWLVASEYTIWPVDHVVYPNRVLREAGLLSVREEADGEHLDLAGEQSLGPGRSSVLAHLLARRRRPRRRAEAVRGAARESTRCSSATDLAKYELNHGRSGQVVSVSSPNSWQAYYWWLDDARARVLPGRWTSTASRATTRWSCTSIRRRAGIPLDASLVKGSHGAPVREEWQQGVILSLAAGRARRPADGRHRRVRTRAAAVWDLRISRDLFMCGTGKRSLPVWPHRLAVPTGGRCLPVAHDFQYTSRW